jgi:hypothetical protein
MLSGFIRSSNLLALFLLGPIRENRSLVLRIVYYLKTTLQKMLFYTNDFIFWLYTRFIKNTGKSSVSLFVVRVAKAVLPR